jgi:hypothetical protein
VWRPFESEYATLVDEISGMHPTIQEYAKTVVREFLRRITSEPEGTKEPNEECSLTIHSRTGIFASEVSDDFDVDQRLVPPPAPKRRVRAKLRFIARAEPRINYNPERD